MVQINFALREVNCKIVYYGPGLSGKTTNLEIIHAKAPGEFRGDLTSIATEGDRTLFFDFLPLNLGTVAGMKTKFQLYTVPGQVFYNSTRKLVLQGVDGIVFVADSRRSKMDENLESIENLRENLTEYGLKLETLPHVIQYNKRDLSDISTIEELQAKLNRYGAPYMEAAAVTGQGVFPTLKKLAGMVLENLNRQQCTSTVQRRKPAKQPVAANAPASPQTAAQASPPAQGGRPAPTPPRGEAGVSQEKVAKGVKTVERRVPVRRKVASGAPAARAGKRAGPGRPAATPSGAAAVGAGASKGSRTWILAMVGILVLGGAGVAAYLLGFLDGLLG